MKYSILILLGVTLCINNLHSQESPDETPEAQKNNQVIDSDTKIENLENDGSLIIKASGFKPKPVPFFIVPVPKPPTTSTLKGGVLTQLLNSKKFKAKRKSSAWGLREMETSKPFQVRES